MILISHRGNTDGPSPKENHPDYLLETYKQYYLEVDIWKSNEQFVLGHDEPTYEVDIGFLERIADKTYFHAKNLDVLHALLEKQIFKCFYHDRDNHTLTSDRYIWTYPEKEITPKSIIVCQTIEQTLNYRDQSLFGICSDYLNFIGSLPG